MAIPNICNGDCIYCDNIFTKEPCLNCYDLSMYKKAEKSEKVNHPSHYNREGAMECIDEMIAVFGIEVVKHFCICNAWKYRYRAADKNGLEDMQKSDWYLKKLKELELKELDDGK